MLAAALRRLLTDGEPAVLAWVESVEGSAPREPGAAMLISGEAIRGTIGGGALEWEVIAAAREMLTEEEPAQRIERRDAALQL